MKQVQIKTVTTIKIAQWIITIKTELHLGETWGCRSQCKRNCVDIFCRLSMSGAETWQTDRQTNRETTSERRRHSITMQRRVYMKSTIALWNVRLLIATLTPRTRITSPSPWSQNASTNDQLRDACCPLANGIEDIDKAAICCVGCHYDLSDVAFCQITLAQLLFKATCELWYT